MPDSSVPLDHGRLVALLGQVAISANLATGPEEALGAALDAIGDELGWPVGQLFLVDEDGGLTLAAAWRTGDGVAFAALRASTEEQSFDHGVGLPGRVLASALPAWISDVAADPDFPRATAAVEAGLRSGAAFPVLVGERVVAVLEFFSREALEPDAVLLDVMRLVGVQLGRVFERRNAVVAAHRAEERTRQILNTSGDAFVAMDADGVITEWNEQATNVFGWSHAEAVGRSVADLIVPEAYREAHRAGMARFLTTGVPVVLGQRLELPSLHRDGHEFPTELTLWALQADDGTWSFYTFARDITARKAAAAQLERQALHDDLTGLANRSLLIDRLTHALQRSDRTGHGPAVLFVDLDGFKLINDSFGHHVGDRLLCEVAARLSGVVRPSDTLSRPAGDEFVIVLDEVDDAAHAAAVATRIGEAFEVPVQIDGERIYVRASVGVALAQAGETAEQLLADADAAMYRAKHEGRARFEMFTEAMRHRASRQLQVETELREAIADPGQLELHYQPVVSLATGQIVGSEGLIRWNHPTRGLLLPAEFIRLAEETGLIVPMGSLVIRDAARQANAWDAEGLHLNMAVNLSARQLAQADFVERVVEDLAASDIDASRMQLCLEITESVLMDDPDTSASLLTELRGLGFRLAIDDFGTGYSSLAYLRDFPVDCVKLDRTFITDVHRSSTDRTIVRSVIDLAHALGLSVVAEGVELEEQVDCLRELGCDLAQGFHFARPTPAAEVTERLRAQRALAGQG